MPTSPTEVTSINEAESRLLQSALSLFAQKGYEGTSIREIIEGAGVTRPVLYYYFENKEDLFRRIVESKFNELTKRIADIKDNFFESLGRLKAIMRTTFALAEESPEAVRLILQVFFAPPQYGPKLKGADLGRQRFRLIEEIMREALDKHELTGGDSRALTLVFLGIMDMHVMAKSDRPEIRLTDELADGLVDLFYYGACYQIQPKTMLKDIYSYM
jgi:TetR/AcrR family transcriptional regulator